MATTSTADLEKRVEALVRTIEAERMDRRREAEAANARIADLEAQLQQQRGSPSSAPYRGGKVSATGIGMSPSAKTPGSAARRPATASGERAPSADGRASSSGRSATARTATSTTPTSKFSKKGSGGGGANGGESAAVAKDPETTAAQHAWDKLCALVKDDFTVKELWLVSLDTLRQLLVHYGVSDPVECAQMECQWALLQEGKEAVDRPTPKRAPSARAKPFEPAKQSGEFDLRPGAAKPALSKRNQLSEDAGTIRSSNPNGLTERARSVSPGSKGGMIMDPIQGSNPNDSVSPGRSHLGKKTWDAPPSTIHRVQKPRGRCRDHSPGPETPSAIPQRDPVGRLEGVKRFSQQQSSEARQRGIKVGYESPTAVDKRQGMRTISSGGGPVNWGHA